MKTCSDGHKTRRAFTLLHLIGVLAILSILVAVLLPALLREIDQSVANQESARLKSFGEAFQQYILSTRTIPDETTWYSAVASKLGLSANDVLYNAHQQSHQQARVFLIDGALQLGALGSGLPYSQPPYFTNTGSGPIQPLSPRAMIVSSLGKALPAAVSSGILNPVYFSNLWNWADGTLLPSDAAWTGWSGNPVDVKVQRINLGPLFVHLTLSTAGLTNSAASGAYYSIDSVAPPTKVPAVVGFGLSGYFIPGSVLSLYTGSSTTNLDTTHILTKDASFYFEQGVWRGSLSGAQLAGSLSIGDVVQQFLAAAPNLNSANPYRNLQQVRVLNSMLSYMSNYSSWAAGGFTDTTLYNYLKNTVQPAMMNDIQGLYGKVGNTSYYPTNPAPCY